MKEKKVRKEEMANVVCAKLRLKAFICTSDCRKMRNGSVVDEYLFYNTVNLSRSVTESRSIQKRTCIGSVISRAPFRMESNDMRSITTGFRFAEEVSFLTKAMLASMLAKQRVSKDG